jgi:hypothetical protein
MKHIITALIQLQDLNFTLQEQKALTAETHLKSLEKILQRYPVTCLRISVKHLLLS